MLKITQFVRHKMSYRPLQQGYSQRAINRKLVSLKKETEQAEDKKTPIVDKQYLEVMSLRNEKSSSKT